MAHRILLIEDNDAFRSTVRRLLEGEGFDVLEAATGKAGIERARTGAPDLVVLDLVLPGLRGTEVCERLKTEPVTAGLPVLILTGNDREGQEAALLDLGADDYVTKPVKSAVLLARCRALLRRLGKGRAVSVGDLKLDYAGKAVVRGSTVFGNLTPKEFDLLYELALASPEPLDRETLYRKVWGVDPPSEGSLKTVDVHARRIRIKLGWAADERLTFVSGRGYRLAAAA